MDGVSWKGLGFLFFCTEPLLAFPGSYLYLETVHVHISLAALDNIRKWFMDRRAL
jgi:hypothetical protein